MLATRPSQNQNPKLYFLEGLLHAKDVLEQLRKSKEEEIQLSPIKRKHTKFSNETIIEDEQEPNHNSPHRHEILHGKSQHQRSQSSNFNLGKHQHYRSSFGRECAGEEIRRQIDGYRQQINEIGKELEEANNQIQGYEVVFEHLCECYRTNTAIVRKSHKLKRQSLRLAQSKEQMELKMKDLEKETEKIEANTKQANKYIQKSVEEYIRDLLKYNIEESIERVPAVFWPQGKSVADLDSEQEENYNKQLKLDFRQYKKQKDEHTQKRVLMEPKKLQKGISFEEEIDVISKYYEAQLSNI